jgi:hypothetical protein
MPRFITILNDKALDIFNWIGLILSAESPQFGEYARAD